MINSYLPLVGLCLVLSMPSYPDDHSYILKRGAVDYLPTYLHIIHYLDRPSSCFLSDLEDQLCETSLDSPDIISPQLTPSVYSYQYLITSIPF
ncbi:uncharacterized protein BP01DRAFT_180081 [Aspergillus saccharolyticus JOP 1030-1]|uniref:Uncharacterized protein n=1 Tax=Aspergillus saccharolyticus JOP 1030-1 TaxID=1450539 RepID=A0A318ZL97_9EURO|nr:hypothetical protein BP01DRAFT_180081 [Aspergillus saccharolyticus JOP 1030-1]PYH48286.1 hypothetical protein BP01DRAFT_180081 [Aspergillus saccharolyticus JOP 1030-1]